MGPSSTPTEVLLLQDTLLSIEKSATTTTESKNLIRQIDVAIATNLYTRPDIYRLYIQRVRESIKHMREAHEKVSLDRSKWGARSIKVMRRLEDLDGEALVATSDGKICILSVDVVKKMRIIGDLKSSSYVETGVIPLEGVTSEILTLIVNYLNEPASVVEITKENVLPLYAATKYLDIVVPEFEKISLHEKCIQSARKLLGLKEYTKEFCAQLAFPEFARALIGCSSIDIQKYSYCGNLIVDFIKNKNDTIYRDNFSNIACYVRALVCILGEKSLPLGYPESVESFLKIFEDFKELEIKEFVVYLDKGGLSPEDLCFIKKLPEKIQFHYQSADVDGLSEVCTIPNLYGLRILDSKYDVSPILLGAELRNIKYLIIPGKGITDDVLGKLAGKLKRLEFLSLQQPDISSIPEGFPELKRFRALGASKLTNEGLLPLTKCQHIEEVNISGCTAVTRFAAAFSKALRRVYAKGSGLTEEAKVGIKSKYILEYID